MKRKNIEKEIPRLIKFAANLRKFSNDVVLTQAESATAAKAADALNTAITLMELLV